jgi:hypothetical protein
MKRLAKKKLVPNRGFKFGRVIAMGSPEAKALDLCVHEGKGLPCHCQMPGAEAIRHAYRLGFFAKKAGGCEAPRTAGRRLAEICQTIVCSTGHAPREARRAAVQRRTIGLS